jgi:hypothetical protein
VAENQLKKVKDSLINTADSAIAKKETSLKDSSNLSRLEKFQRKLEEFEKAKKQLTELEQRIKTSKKRVQDSLNIVKQKVSRLNNPDSVKSFIKENKIDTKDLPAGWKTLMNLRTFGLGRTWIDYSELTVKNISLSGVNIEYTPGPFYFAFAAGGINYRFRDFIVKNNDQPKQTLWLARAGWGAKEGNNIIFTYYDGKRNLLNSFNNISAPNSLERVIGISIENRLAIDKNNYAILEMAKSSFHNTGTLNQGTSQLMKKVWDLNDHSNEAYSIKLHSYIPQSSTRITGYYKKLGEHFQSFNLHPVNVDQVSFLARVQQSFWKQKLTAEAAIRKNDFTNPYINPGLSSKTIFKSFQVGLRIPKYPFISIGYYPSSQLTMLNNNVLVENQYNTLTGVLSYSYPMKKISMNSSAVYLKYYNHNSDTGFIYYNASSLSLNQNIFWKSLQVQTGITFIHQLGLDVFTWEESFNWQLNTWLTFGSGLKYNRVRPSQTFWGGTANVGIQINKLGNIQLLYDRSYLPGDNRNLLPIDMGRVCYYRIF